MSKRRLSVAETVKAEEAEVVLAVAVVAPVAEAVIEVAREEDVVVPEVAPPPVMHEMLSIT